MGSGDFSGEWGCQWGVGVSVGSGGVSGEWGCQWGVGILVGSGGVSGAVRTMSSLALLSCQEAALTSAGPLSPSKAG